MNVRNLAVLSVVFAAFSASAQVELRNDGFTSGDSPGFQAGFSTGEMAGSRFVPPSAAQLLEVRFLFGGATGTRDIVLHVWDDSAGTDAPGASLFSSTYTLTASDQAMQSIDLSGDNVLVSGTFRVGIEMTAGGTPSIARDTDNTIATDYNFLNVSGLGWVKSSVLGVQGDWIIRAVVTGGTADAGADAGVADAGGMDSGVADAGDMDSGIADAGNDVDSGVPGADGGSGCTSNAQCATGSYCGSAGTCTFDCRTDSDCGSGNSCNSLGQCVAAEKPTGCGCASVEFVPFALLALGLLLRRRR